MTTHYLGTLATGSIVARKSTNPHFTHAAAAAGFKTGGSPLPNFSTSENGAARNFENGHCRSGAYEVVAVRKVDAKEYRETIAAAKARGL